MNLLIRAPMLILIGDGITSFHGAKRMSCLTASSIYKASAHVPTTPDDPQSNKAYLDRVNQWQVTV